MGFILFGGLLFDTERAKSHEPVSFTRFFPEKAVFPPNTRSVVCVNAEKGVSDRTP